MDRRLDETRDKNKKRDCSDHRWSDNLTDAQQQRFYSIIITHVTRLQQLLYLEMCGTYSGDLGGGS